MSAGVSDDEMGSGTNSLTDKDGTFNTSSSAATVSKY